MLTFLIVVDGSLLGRLVTLLIGTDESSGESSEMSSLDESPGSSMEPTVIISPIIINTFCG